MSIRFKFRSSLNFETLEIGSRDSISVAELRAKIMCGKVSQQQQGFDLVFSDADSGLGYNCDSQIPSGSSVIVKRVPGGTLPSSVAVPIVAMKHAGLKEPHNLNLAKTGPKNDYDDLGVDLYPKPDSNLPGFNQELDQNKFKGNKKDAAAIIPSGFDQHGNDRNVLPLPDELMKSNKLHKSNFQNVKGSNLPIELKCPLCKNVFMDAVMIPCCQHSFCEKCIYQVLFTKGMCPKCYSIKCTTADLLPNLSLRQATEHLLKSEMFDTGFDNAMQKYVPDEESGIQMNDDSRAITFAQFLREMGVPQSSIATGKGPVPQSSTATGKGSNQILTESLHEQHQRNVQYGDAGCRDFEDFAQSADFQGENQPKSHAEADSDAKRKGGFCLDLGAGGISFSGHGRYRKDVRNCFSCGSFDHLMKDCPSSHPNPMCQPGSGVFHGGIPGYAPQYWNGSSFPPYTPYANMYNNPSMMPFNPTMVPVSPFVAPPPYIPLPGPGGNMRLGNVEPPRLDHFGIQHCGSKRKKLLNENLESRNQLLNKDGSSECYRHYSPQKAYDREPQKDREQSSSHSDASLVPRPGRKDRHEKYLHSGGYSDERHGKSHHAFSGREKRLSHAERSNSAKEDKSRSTERHCEGRHMRHHRDSKDSDRKGHYDSDSSFGHHSTLKHAKRKIESDARDSHRNHHHNQADYTFEPWTPADRRARAGYCKREAGQDSSRHHTKHLQERHHGDRLQVLYGSNEDRRDEYRPQKHRAY
ncbi:E3 ubiquitin ligase PQT3-like [Salvia splendens]|uniref:E3 ubiquitin ligase PQT3-like n=1 Tax=Salvia splendens TaxID=180675 RepID=UPI001C2777C4|nr:E3 ubiquitin ligase PQT3-like [Salvia splendens]XP_042037460.1 E3 ubiquitin ligase PQT3-like [Salvia splendens]XP_042037461.1 E3 ubiquitin ligase PQT3-like [Salvia splendens]XP_042037462.1 E3 ubiquitin ligase PQT3-like [Salvia splendens]